jgi:two-component system, OmpR family, sensor kinase
MNLPICIRLTVWYAALFSVTALVLSGFIVVQLRADLTESVDDRLTIASMELTRSLADDADDDRPDPDDPAEDLADFREAARTMLSPSDAGAQLLDAEGRPLVRHGLFGRPAPDIPDTVRAAALAGGPQTMTVSGGQDGERYRMRVSSFEARGEVRILVLEESLRPVELAVRRVLLLLLVGGPVALLVTSLGAYWIARKAVEPVERITTDANEIGLDRLDERVAVPRAHDETRRLAETLNAMLARIERGVVDKHRLVADASHELRTPLAVMRSEIDVAMADDDLAQPAREVLLSAREEVDRMTRTVDNLLTSAQADEGHLELLTETTDLRQLVDEAVHALEPLARTKGVWIVADGDRLKVQADALRLQLVLTNLIDNAVKFSPPGGTVAVHTWHDGTELGVTVSDRGPGIRDSDKSLLFKRYYRAEDPLTANVGGSGLGLAICDQVAAAHGGAIRVDGRPGGGSTFTLALPAWRASEPSRVVDLVTGGATPADVDQRQPG